ncbi:phosphotransferase family protein [Actinokineospora inagensis]|uniref:phosphotransferase family protein n=1 Tax=Actinokineospora inagensis TaxID=103730 RepID=UPI001FE1E3E2|nr:aminoglycoside phosphotransferase family protein [Actinokineospora inagensis]
MVTARLGSVTSVVDITVGGNSDLAVVVTSAGGERVFVKAVRGVRRQMRWLRNEIVGNAAARGLAPAVLFHEDIAAEDAVDDQPWLVVGMEYVGGRAVDLSPGSPDLDVVGATLERIAAIPAPTGIWPLSARWAPTDWWHRCAENSPADVAGYDIEQMTRIGADVPHLVSGDRLVHTDLHGDQILLTPDSQVRVIDWGYPGVGAPWVDTTLIVLRLIEAGHRPAEAEAWGRGLQMFRDLDPDIVDAFAAYTGGLWTHFAITRSGSPHGARVARQWATWRIERRAQAPNAAG